MIEYYERLADAIEARATGAFDAFLTIYVTKGGTLIIASRGSVTDSGKPRDLAAILPADLGAGRVLPLWLAVNPELITGLEAALLRREGR